MKEAVVYAYTCLTLVGGVAGTVVYHVNNPEPREYRPDMTRATTVTGRGQFRCQIGCQHDRHESSLLSPTGPSGLSHRVRPLGHSGGAAGCFSIHHT